jgi:hypothetical protein
MNSQLLQTVILSIAPARRLSTSTSDYQHIPSTSDYSAKRLGGEDDQPIAAKSTCSGVAQKGIKPHFVIIEELT